MEFRYEWLNCRSSKLGECFNAIAVIVPIELVYERFNCARITGFPQANGSPPLDGAFFLLQHINKSFDGFRISDVAQHHYRSLAHILVTLVPQKGNKCIDQCRIHLRP